MTAQRQGKEQAIWIAGKGWNAFLTTAKAEAGGSINSKMGKERKLKPTFICSHMSITTLIFDLPLALHLRISLSIKKDFILQILFSGKKKKSSDDIVKQHY